MANTAQRKPACVDVMARIPVDLVRVLDVIADAEDSTRSRIVRRAVREFVASSHGTDRADCAVIRTRGD